MAQSIATSNDGVKSSGQSGLEDHSTTALIWAMTKSTARKFGSIVVAMSARLGARTWIAPDIDRVAVTLDVENRGAADGRNGLPAANEEVVSGTQREIIAFFKDLQRKAREKAARSGDRLRQMGDDIDVTDSIGGLRDIPSRCENEIQRCATELRSRLRLVREREIEQQQRYADRRERGEPDRAAGSQGSAAIHIVMAAALIVAGVTAIGMLLPVATGSGTSIADTGTMLILTLAVFVPLAIAREGSYPEQDAQTARSTIIWIGNTIAMLFVTALAFFAVHYVSALSAGRNASLRGVLDALLLDPTAVGSDFTAWKAFGIVMLAGALALVLGYRSVDSRASRALENRFDRRERNKSERVLKRMRRQINGIVDKADREAVALTTRLKTRVRQYCKAADAAKRMPQMLGDYDVALEDACNILLDRYRAANRNARKTPLPASFSAHVCFRADDDAISTACEEQRRRHEELLGGLAGMESEVVRVRQKLRELNRRAISAFDDDLTGDAGFDSGASVSSF